MKKIIATFLALLLLAACSKASPLCATWMRSGQFAENVSYEETFTLSADGTATVTIDLNGKPNQTLHGTWRADDKTLFVTIEADPAYTNEYQYTIDGEVLSLTKDDEVHQYHFVK